MLFPPVDRVSEQELESGLRNLVKDAVYAQAVGTLSAGVLLVGFALSLGASNFVIGLLAAVPLFAQLVQVPGILLVERMRQRRMISIVCSILSRALLIPLALIPFLDSLQWAQAFLVIGVGLSAALGAVGACSWNSWIHDLVPERALGNFFARRLFYGTAVSMVLGLAAGYFVRWWEASGPGLPAHVYTALFLLAAVAGALSTFHLSRVPEPRMAEPERAIRLWPMLAEPFRNHNFRHLIWFLGSWHFATNLAAPFFAVYLVSQLGYDMAFVILMMITSQTSNLLFIRQWGNLTDRFSNKAVLRVCGPLHLICIFAWILVALPEQHAYSIPLLTVLHIVMGFAAAGVNLASGNIGLKLAPRGRGTAYLATTSLVNSVAAGVAPIIGGLFADDFVNRELSLILRWVSGPRSTEFITLQLRHWDFFFLLACLFGLYSLHRLAMVKEEGQVEDRTLLVEIIAETRRGMAGLSPIAGMRLMTLFPFGRLLQDARTRRAGRRSPRREPSP